MGVHGNPLSCHSFVQPPENMMTMEQVMKLRSGDEVFWTDPDRGACSRTYKIATIQVHDDAVVSIVDVDGASLECFAHELS